MVEEKFIWLPTKAVAKINNVTSRAIRQAAHNGKYNYKIDKSCGGSGKMLIQFPKTAIINNEQNSGAAEAEENGLTRKNEIENFNFEKEIPDHYLRIGQVKAQLCNRILAEIELGKHPIEEIYRLYAKDYQYNSNYDELRRLTRKDKYSPRTLKRMVSKYQKSEKDYLALTPGYIRGGKKKVNINPDELFWLKNQLLNQNRIKIGTAIRYIKILAGRGTINSSSSSSTLRRAANQIINENKNEYYLARNGEEAFKNNRMKTILRDWSKSKVGDILIADGHRLDIKIIDPNTGKPKRMLLIVFMDAASRYICGASIAANEDTANISAAFRMAIINLGRAPRYVYIDNGKAFGAKYFHDKNLEHELGGLYDRLGCKVIFAEPYNAKAKIVERFFSTFTNDFSRRMLSFTGTSTKDRPASYKRNELWMRANFDNSPPTLEEAIKMINYYCCERYAKQPHGGIDNKTPADIFWGNKPKEKIDKNQLDNLMMAVKNRKVGRQGIQLFNELYWSPELIYFVGDNITVRYDSQDLTYIKIYNDNNKFICDAEKREYQAAFLNSQEAKKKLNKERAEIGYTLDKVKKSTSEMLEEINSENTRKRNISQRPALNSVFNDSRLITAPWDRPGISCRDKYKLFIKHYDGQFTQKIASEMTEIKKETIKKLTQEFENKLLQCITIKDRQKVYQKIDESIQIESNPQIELFIY